mgnify:FL=1
MLKGRLLQNRTYIEWSDAQQAMRIVDSRCDHPDESVVWKLQTYEYVCRACETVFSYDELRKIVDDAQKDKTG